MIPTALDSLKYAVAQAESVIDWATDHIGGAEHMTEALENEIDCAQEGLSDLAKTLRSLLVPHVKDRNDWFTYSDGRPLRSVMTIDDHYVYSHLWHPNPLADPPEPHTTQISTGLEVPAYRTATVSYELPSKMIIKVGDEVIAESGQGDADVLIAQLSEPHASGLARHLEIVEFIAENAGPDRAPLDPSPDQIRQMIDHITERRRSQPERIFDLRTKIIIARDEALQAEPWSSFVTDIPAFTKDGEPAGSMGVPNLSAKEMFGTRLALELAAEAGGEEDVRDTINEYFSMIREPDQMMLVAMSALSVMGTMVLPALFEVAEEKACNWDIRVNFADTARHTWTKRIRDFNSDDATSA